MPFLHYFITNKQATGANGYKRSTDIFGENLDGIGLDIVLKKIAKECFFVAPMILMVIIQ